MNISRTLVVAAVMLLAVSAYLPQASIAADPEYGAPNTFSAAFRITDSLGDPYPLGTYDFTFEIYDDSVGGTLLSTQTESFAIIEGGLIDTHSKGLRLPPPPPPPGGQFHLWLQISSAKETFLPRIKIQASAFSIASRTLAGDVYTGRGELWVFNDSLPGSAQVRVLADGSAGEMNFYSPGDTVSPAIHMSTGDNNPVIELQHPFMPGSLRFDTVGITFPDGSVLREGVVNSGVARQTNDILITLIPTGYTTLTSSVINCPTNGYILAIGTCQPIYNHHTGYSSEATYGLSDDSSSLGAGVQDLRWTIPAGAATGDYVNVVTVHGIFQAVEGINEIYFLVNKSSSSIDTIDIWDEGLSLMFIPESYGITTVDKMAISSMDGDESERAETADAYRPVNSDQNMDAVRNEIDALNARITELQGQVRALLKQDKSEPDSDERR